MAYQRISLSFLARVPVFLLLPACLMLCVSCASTSIERDDGIVGLVHSLIVEGKQEEPSQAGQETAEPAQHGVVGETAPEQPRKPPEEAKRTMPRYPTADYVYRLSSGDEVTASFFRKPPAKDSGEYRVNALDVLTVEIAGAGTVSSYDATVRMDGKISLFQIDDVSVRGKTVGETRKILKEALAKTMPGADVAVLLKKGDALIEDFLSTLEGTRPVTTLGGIRSVVVRPDGLISLPLIGDFNVIGMSLEQVRAAAETRYEEILGSGLSVSLALTKTRQNSPILGEVNRPGLYSLYEPVHPLSAIALAGGQLDTAAIGDVILLKKREDGSFDRHDLDLRASAMAKNNGYVPVFMEPDDILIVPKSGIAKANLWVEQYIRNLLPVPTGASASYVKSAP